MSFPEPYRSDPRTNVIIIKGDRLNMTTEQEEMAVAWAKKDRDAICRRSCVSDEFPFRFFETVSREIQGREDFRYYFSNAPGKGRADEGAKEGSCGRAEEEKT